MALTDGQIIEGSDGKEKIVFDFDKDGKQIGFHKEVVKESK